MSTNVVGVVGGLGNQLFQYAFAAYLEERSGFTSRLDLSAFRRRPEYLGLAALGLTEIVERRSLRSMPHVLGSLSGTGTIARMVLSPRTLMLNTHPSQQVSREAMSVPRWWYGYWQREEFVTPVLDRMREEIWPGGLPALQRSIGMHIRRGDAVATAWTLGASYYPEALRRLRAANPEAAQLPVVVYSDDPDWCRAEVPIDGAEYLQPGEAADDLRRLAAHRWLVLSGSTYSWWAARLLPHEHDAVIAPSPFSGVEGQHLESDGWLLLDRPAQPVHA